MFEFSKCRTFVLGNQQGEFQIFKTTLQGSWVRQAGEEIVLVVF